MLPFSPRLRFSWKINCKLIAAAHQTLIVCSSSFVVLLMLTIPASCSCSGIQVFHITIEYSRRWWRAMLMYCCNGKHELLIARKAKNVGIEINKTLNNEKRFRVRKWIRHEEQLRGRERLKWITLCYTSRHPTTSTPTRKKQIMMDFMFCSISQFYGGYKL